MSIHVETKSLQVPDVALDPMADWLVRNISNLAGSDVVLSVLVHLREGKTASDFAVGPGGGLLADWKSAVVVPSLYVKAQAPWSNARFCTARIKPVFLSWLARMQSVKDIVEGITICAPPAGFSQVLAGGPRGRGLAGGPRSRGKIVLGVDAVVSGVIDFGLPIAHPALNAEGTSDTRIVSAWFQGEGATPNGPLTPQPDFGYGSEITGPAIDTQRQASGAENTFYHDTGLFRPAERETYWSRHPATHASAVIGLAADCPKAGMAPPMKDKDRPIILVQLPYSTVDDGSGHSLAAHALDAMRYIIERACSIKAGEKQAPLVMTLSYGNNAGPHDGMGPFEQAMAELVELWNDENQGIPLAIVISAGNSFQDEMHAAWTGADLKTEQLIGWFINPDDATPNIAQIWMPTDFAGDATVLLTAPDGQKLTVASKGAHYVTLRSGGPIVAQAQWFPQIPGGHHRSMVQLIVGATGRDADGKRSPGSMLAPAGRWTISILAPDLAKDQRVDAWVQRDDVPLRATPAARQSFFQHENYMRYRPTRQPADGTVECGPLRRPGSINAIGTGPGTIVVGSSFRNSDLLPLYTGGGDEGMADGNGIVGVDVTVRSDDSPLNLGQIVMGMHGGSTVRRYGTSLAAPMAAAYIANNMAAFVAAAPKSMKQTIQSMAIPKKHLKPGTVDPRDGAGSLP